MNLRSELIERIYIAKVMRARSMSPEEKLLAPARLFDYLSKITMAGIRNQNPDASEEQIQQLFQERLTLRRRLEGRT